MIDRLLYVATALALASLLALDGNFAENLSRALGGPLGVMPVDIWEVSVAGILAGLIVVAFVRQQ